WVQGARPQTSEGLWDQINPGDRRNTGGPRLQLDWEKLTGATYEARVPGLAVGNAGNGLARRKVSSASSSSARLPDDLVTVLSITRPVRSSTKATTTVPDAPCAARG